MDTLAIATVQFDMVWEKPEANHHRLNQLLGSLTAPVDLIVFPEMFTTGFKMNPKICAEPMNGPTMQWMREKAKEKNAVLTGSIVIKENETFFNRMIWMRPDGTFEQYDKKHLFRMSDEFAHYEHGDKRCIVELKGWKFNLNICYDLRFPVWARNSVNDKGEFAYDVLIYVASWTNSRAQMWQKLLPARAIENQAYVIGVNRVGTDGEGYPYDGDSRVIDPLGTTVYRARPGKEEIVISILSKDLLNSFRNNFQVWKDWDEFELRIKN